MTGRGSTPSPRVFEWPFAVSIIPGTHTGSFARVPPSDRRVAVSGMAIGRLIKTAGSRSNGDQADMLGLVEQLGVDQGAGTVEDGKQTAMIEQLCRWLLDASNRKSADDFAPLFDHDFPSVGFNGGMMNVPNITRAVLRATQGWSSRLSIRDPVDLS
jgi:hypothetical protein